MDFGAEDFGVEGSDEEDFGVEGSFAEDLDADSSAENLDGDSSAEDLRQTLLKAPLVMA